MRSLLRSFLAVTAGNYIAIAFSFLGSVLLTRTLGAERFGRLALLLVASQVLGVVAANWTITGLVRFASHEHASRESMSNSLWARLALVLPGAVLALALMAVLAAPIAGYLGVPASALWIVAAHFVATTAFATSGALFQATGRMTGFGGFLVLERTIALILLASLAFTGALDATLALVSFAASSAVTSVAMFARLGLRVLLPARTTREHVDELWRFSLPLIGSTWAGVFGGQWIDYIFVRRFLSLDDLGHYSLAYQLAGVVQQVTIVASTLLLPRFSVLLAEGRDNEVATLVRRAIPSFLLALSLGLAVVLVAADVAVPLVFGGAFSDTVPPLRLLVLATIALALANTCTPLLAAQGATWTITRVVLISAAANVILDVLLIPRLGIEGAAAATLLSYSVAAALFLAAQPVRRTVPTLRYAAYAIPALGAFACVSLLAPPASLVAALTVAAVTGAVIARVLGTLARSG